MKRLKLKWMEFRIAHGDLGWAFRYERLCLERNATTVAEKLKVAEEVVSSETCIGERRCNIAYLKNHKKA